MSVCWSRGDAAVAVLLWLVGQMVQPVPHHGGGWGGFCAGDSFSTVPGAMALHSSTDHGPHLFLKACRNVSTVSCALFLCGRLD